MKPISIFSDFYGFDNLIHEIDFLKLNEEIHNYIKKYDPKGRTLSNQGGYQSNNIDYNIVRNEYKLITDLLNIIDKKCKLFLNNENIFLLNSWININTKYDYNRLHYHPYSVLSGSIYLDIPLYDNETDGRFVFRRCREFEDYNMEVHARNLDPIYKNISESINPKTGDILIFPSYLQHEVMPHLSKNNRISIAFNTSSTERDPQ